MSKLVGKAVVAQGGGPTAVINQSLVGVVLEARKFDCIQNVYGALHGVSGIVNEDFLDLAQATTHNLEMVAKTPCSAMLSTRDKPDAEYCARDFQGAEGTRCPLFLLYRRQRFRRYLQDRERKCQGGRV